MSEGKWRTGGPRRGRRCPSRFFVEIELPLARQPRKYKTGGPRRGPGGTKNSQKRPSSGRAPQKLRFRKSSWRLHGSLHFDVRGVRKSKPRDTTTSSGRATAGEGAREEVVQIGPARFLHFRTPLGSSRGGPGSLPGALGGRRGDFESFPSEKKRLRGQARPGKTAFFGIGLPPAREHRF